MSAQILKTLDIMDPKLADGLKEITFADLQQLKVKINQAVEERREMERVALREKFQKEAQQNGFTLVEVVSDVAPRLIKSGQPERDSREPTVKYRHPDNPSKTWSGRGRKPKWIKELAAEGKEAVTAD